MTIKAIIFDLDGVITDTSAFHYQAWSKLANNLAIEFNEEDNERIKGVDRMGSLDYILDKGNINLSGNIKALLAEEKNQDYVGLLAELSPSDLYPGVLPLLQTLKEQGYKLGVASASKNALMVLNKLGVADRFDYIADSAKIANGKPAPDIFLDVAEHLAIAPEDCLGIEDSQAGITAINSAGMASVGVGSISSLAAANQVYPDMQAVKSGLVNDFLA